MKLGQRTLAAQAICPGRFGLEARATLFTWLGGACGSGTGYQTPAILSCLNYRKQETENRKRSLQIQYRIAEQVVYFGGQFFRGREGQGIGEGQDAVFLGIQEV
jgi:hypothetical protein